MSALSLHRQSLLNRQKTLQRFARRIIHKFKHCGAVQSRCLIIAAFAPNLVIVVSGPGARHSAINVNNLITCESDTLVDFSLYDYLAIAAFFLLWAGYSRYSGNLSAGRVNLVSAMADRRQAWMEQMLTRDNRIVDIQILRSLGGSASFFASTSILVLAGLIAVLGATDKAIELLRDFPFSISVSRELWEVKVMTLIVVFIYAFFKFGWAMRQLNYCSIMVGSVGSSDNVTENDRERAKNAANVATIASSHTNRGIRAYYFGLALLAWHIHPFALIASTLTVVLVLYRREFHSRTLRLIVMDQSDEQRKK